MSGYDISGVLDDSWRVGHNALLKLGKQIAEVRSIGVKSVEFTLGSLGTGPWMVPQSLVSVLLGTLMALQVCLIGSYSIPYI